MTQCPKCGCCLISGPVYEHNQGKNPLFKFNAEWLRYRCTRCGYSQTTPTNDAKKERKAP